MLHHHPENEASVLFWTNCGSKSPVLGSPAYPCSLKRVSLLVPFCWFLCPFFLRHATLRSPSVFHRFSPPTDSLSLLFAVFLPESSIGKNR
jgi:hypothetical protein